MRISNKADYALHAMLYVSSVEGTHAASINEIAREEGIPREYLAKVLKELTHHRLLKSTRGINGGYFLTKPKSEYTILEVLEAMDGPINPSNCTKPEARRTGHRKGRCAATPIFEGIKEKLIKDLSISFSDIPFDIYQHAAKKNNNSKERNRVKVAGK